MRRGDRIACVIGTTACILIAVGGSAAHASSPLVNPGADDSEDTLPGWEGNGFVPVAYDADPSVPAAPDWPSQGARLFRADRDGARISQTVTVDDVSAEIDAGRQPVWISGRFGGPGGSDASVALVARFRAATGAELGSAEVGGPDDAQRAGQTRLLYCSRSVSIPAGTDRILVEVAGGPGGLADALDVTTVQPGPPPGIPGTLHPSTGCFDPLTFGFVPPPHPPPCPTTTSDVRNDTLAPPVPVPTVPPPPAPGPPACRPAAPAVRSLLALPSSRRCMRSGSFSVRLRRAALGTVRSARLRARDRTRVLRPGARESARFKAPRAGRSLRVAATVMLSDGARPEATVRLRRCRTGAASPRRST